jgi:hypothetical protein
MSGAGKLINQIFQHSAHTKLDNRNYHEILHQYRHNTCSSRSGVSSTRCQGMCRLCTYYELYDILQLICCMYASQMQIPSLRAYANELKVSSNGQQACQLPSEVQGERSWTDCQDGEAWETSQVIYFKQFGGDNKRCVRGNGSARTNGSFSDVGTVEDCADKCVGREPGVGLGTVLGFNYDCEAKTCQW